MSCDDIFAGASSAAEVEQSSRGVVQAAALRDRLHNRERQSMSQMTTLASRLQGKAPGLVHAVKNVTTARKSITYIIFLRQALRGE